MHAVPALRLAVQTPRRIDGSIARPELRQSIFGTQVSAESLGLFDATRSGAVEFNGISPGHYELSQGDPPRVMDLDATASLQVDASAGTPTVGVSGTLRMASGAPTPDNVNVQLTWLEGAPAGSPCRRWRARGALHFGRAAGHVGGDGGQRGPWRRRPGVAGGVHRRGRKGARRQPGDGERPAAGPGGDGDAGRDEYPGLGAQGRQRICRSDDRADAEEPGRAARAGAAGPVGLGRQLFCCAMWRPAATPWWPSRTAGSWTGRGRR